MIERDTPYTEPTDWRIAAAVWVLLALFGAVIGVIVAIGAVVVGVLP